MTRLRRAAPARRSWFGGELRTSRFQSGGLDEPRIAREAVELGHLQHQQSILFPMSIEALVWITAIIRIPELLERILRKRVSSALKV